MPESVAEVGGGVFYDCAGLVSIKLSDNLAALPYYSYIDSNSQANTKGFFEGCTSLKAIALPENLTQVVIPNKNMTKAAIILKLILL